MLKSLIQKVKRGRGATSGENTLRFRFLRFDPGGGSNTSSAAKEKHDTKAACVDTHVNTSSQVSPISSTPPEPAGSQPFISVATAPLEPRQPASVSKSLCALETTPVLSDAISTTPSRSDDIPSACKRQRTSATPSNDTGVEVSTVSTTQDHLASQLRTNDGDALATGCSRERRTHPTTNCTVTSHSQPPDKKCPGMVSPYIYPANNIQAHKRARPDNSTMTYRRQRVKTEGRGVVEHYRPNVRAQTHRGVMQFNRLFRVWKAVLCGMSIIRPYRDLISCWFDAKCGCSNCGRAFGYVLTGK